MTAVGVGMIKNTEEQVRELFSLVENLYYHLQYCGWGDNWERECSRDLQEEAATKIERYRTLLSEDIKPQNTKDAKKLIKKNVCFTTRQNPQMRYGDVKLARGGEIYIGDDWFRINDITRMCDYDKIKTS